ncbi:hypothetical protein BSL78_15158 [Apostichopus japonicus]|uniref:Uncharacterized protein n=1 Tax=Stichopus japonicus TaxID=307972 RepID=A0A2G8KJ11_STIJA|nr:hypothetical protein BSL78_15158 [Apostichopus japonicus]
MAGEVTAVIDLCTLVADVGLKAYNAAQKISTNFEEERKSLGERVKEMRQRVDRLREELEKDQTHNLKGIYLKVDNSCVAMPQCDKVFSQRPKPKELVAQGSTRQEQFLKIAINKIKPNCDNKLLWRRNLLLSIGGIKEVLEDIKSEFKKIEKFFIKLDGYGDLRGLKWLLQKIKNFRSVERKFEDFNSNLEELQKKLAENIPEGILKVVLGNNQIILDVREQQAAIIKIQQRDQYKMRELLKDNAALQENLRLVTDRTTYIQKRVAVILNIKPDELTDETALAAGSFCDYSTAMLDGEKVVVKRVRDVKLYDSSAATFIFLQRFICPCKFARETRNLILSQEGASYVCLECGTAKMKNMWFWSNGKGTLKKLLKEEENLSLENKLTLALTAARSLSRMHTTLVHTALRTDKFLVDKDYTAKLSGMGYAMTFSSCRRFVVADRLDDFTCTVPRTLQTTKTVERSRYIRLWNRIMGDSYSNQALLQQTRLIPVEKTSII